MNNASGTLRVIPTAEELKILREKLNNIQDLYIFKSPGLSKNPSHISIGVGQTRNNSNLIEEKSSYITREYGPKSLKSSRNSKVLTKENLNHDFSHENITIKDKSERETEKGRNVNLLVNHQSSRFNLSFPEKEAEILSQRYLDMQRFLEVNKEKVEKIEKYDELLKENEFLKNELDKNQMLEGNLTFIEILNDYMRMKSENISLQKRIEDDEKHILNIEKENKLLRDIDSNTPMNKMQLKLLILSLLSNNFEYITKNEEMQKSLYDVFGNSPNIVNFLTQRIDTLELQNFQLINKIEKYTQMLKNHLNDLIEFCEVMGDIRNVFNLVYDTQSISNEFLIIREALNNRNSYILNQKQSFLDEKKQIDKDKMIDINMNVILCKDKIIETKINMTNNSQKSINNLQNNKIFDILDEKIELYESMKNNLAQYDDYINKNKQEGEENENMDNLAENLMNENYILKSKNIRLTEFLSKLINNTNLENEINEEMLNELNEISNTQRDVAFSEDLFNMLKAQSLIIENNLITK